MNAKERSTAHSVGELLNDLREFVAAAQRESIHFDSVRPYVEKLKTIMEKHVSAAADAHAKQTGGRAG